MSNSPDTTISSRLVYVPSNTAILSLCNGTDWTAPCGQTRGLLAVPLPQSNDLSISILCDKHTITFSSPTLYVTGQAWASLSHDENECVPAVWWGSGELVQYLRMWVGAFQWHDQNVHYLCEFLDSDHARWQTCSCFMSEAKVFFLLWWGPHERR